MCHGTGQQVQLVVSEIRILRGFSVSNLAYLVRSSTYDSSCTFLFFELSKLYERTGKGCLLRLPKSTSLVKEVFVSRQFKLLLGLYCRVVFFVDIHCVFNKKERGRIKLIPFNSNFYVNCLFSSSGPLLSAPGDLIASQLKAQAYITAQLSSRGLISCTMGKVH